MLWHCLRQAALWRHAMWNLLLENGDAERWKAHEAAIKRFYGY